MTIDLEQIRSANSIEDVVAQRFALKKAGTRFIGVEHDSLVIVPRTQMYFWNSKDEQGDVFDFTGRHLLNLGTWNSRDPAQFIEAVRYLAQRAGIALEDDESFRRSHTWAERQLVQRLHDALRSGLGVGDGAGCAHRLHARRQTRIAGRPQPAGQMARGHPEVSNGHDRLHSL
jgi:DNA primase